MFVREPYKDLVPQIMTTLRTVLITLNLVTNAGNNIKSKQKIKLKSDAVTFKQTCFDASHLFCFPTVYDVKYR